MAAELVGFLHAAVLAPQRDVPADADGGNAAVASAASVDWVQDRLLASKGGVLLGSALEYILEMVGDVFWLHLEDIALIEMGAALYRHWLLQAPVTNDRSVHFGMCRQLMAVFETKRVPEGKAQVIAALVQRHIDCMRAVLSLLQEYCQAGCRREDWTFDHSKLMTQMTVGLADALLREAPCSVSTISCLHPVTGASVLMEQPGYLANELVEQLVIQTASTMITLGVRSETVWQTLAGVFPGWLPHRVQVVLIWTAMGVALTERIAAILYGGSASAPRLNLPWPLSVDDDEYAVYAWQRVLGLFPAADAFLHALSPPIFVRAVYGIDRMVQVFHSVRGAAGAAPYAPFFPSPNSILRCFGSWLFGAARRIGDEACEEGRAQAMSTLCRIVTLGASKSACAPPEQRQLSRNFRVQFLEAYRAALGADLTTLVAVLMEENCVLLLPWLREALGREIVVVGVRRILPTMAANAVIRRAVSVDDLRRACYKIMGGMFAIGVDRDGSSLAATIVETATASLLTERNAGNGRYLINQLTSYAMQHAPAGCGGLDAVLVDNMPGWPLDVQLTACASLAVLLEEAAASKLIAYAASLLTQLLSGGNANAVGNARLFCAACDALCYRYTAGACRDGETVLEFVALLTRACRIINSHSGGPGTGAAVLASSAMPNTAAYTVRDSEQLGRLMRFFPSWNAAERDDASVSTGIVVCLEERIRSFAHATLHRLFYLLTVRGRPLVGLAGHGGGRLSLLMNGMLVDVVQEGPVLRWAVRGPAGSARFDFRLSRGSISAGDGASKATTLQMPTFHARKSAASPDPVAVHFPAIARLGAQVDEEPADYSDECQHAASSAPPERQTVPLAVPPSGVPSDALDLSRLLLLHLAIPVVPLSVDSHDAIDRLPTREQVHVSLHNCSPASLLANRGGAPSSGLYRQFIRSLGYRTPNSPLYSSGSTYEIFFHQHGAQRDTGSVVTSIVWLESAASPDSDYGDEMLLRVPSHLPGSIVYLVVRPVPVSNAHASDGLFLQCRIIVNLSPISANDSEPLLLLFGPLLDGMLCSAEALPALITRTALTAHRYCKKDILGEWSAVDGVQMRADRIAQCAWTCLNASGTAGSGNWLAALL